MLKLAQALMKYLIADAPGEPRTNLQNTRRERMQVSWIFAYKNVLMTRSVRLSPLQLFLDALDLDTVIL